MNGTEKKILLVEDEPSAQTLYRNRLQREGFQISFAEDGDIAFNSLTNARPDLVVLDLMLPKVNGAEMLNRIRSQEQLKNMPILLISNAYMTEMSQKAMESGATRGLLKTECTPARLVETVRDMLGFESAFTLSDKLSDDKHMEQFVAAAEGALADEMTLKETREDFIKKAPAEVARIREHCVAYVKAGETPAAQEPLNKLYQQVRFFATRAGLAGCIKTALLANAFEALLFETIYKPAKASPSAPQTFAQAVDCLEHLCHNKNTGIGETIPKAKIMVVDDDPICNFAVVAALKRAHFEPVSFEDPGKAIEMAKDTHYDVIFLDINMPGMNGFEVCEKLRKLPTYKETPMIFITSNADFNNRAQSILSGGNDLIPKPISPVELVLKTTIRLVSPLKAPAGKTLAAAVSKNMHVNGVPEIATLPFTVPTETEIFRKSSTTEIRRLVDLPKESAPKNPAELPKPLEKLAPAAEAKDKVVAPAKLEVKAETKVETKAETKVEPPKAEAVAIPGVSSLKMAAPGSPAQPPKPIESTQSEVKAKVELPKPIEPAKLTLAAEAKDKPAAPAPLEVKAKVEAPKLPEPEKLALAAEAKDKPAAPAKLEAKAEAKSELPKPIEPAKLIVPVEANDKPVAMAEAKVEIKIEPQKVEPQKIELPKAETVPAPKIELPVQPKPLPTKPPEKPTHIKSEQTNKTMETNNKPTFDEAARGVARIIFGDDNISDMNVRLTKIALERYNVPGKSIDEVSRGVAQIIFGDDKISDMNVRLTKIALERYNITEVLGHANGASKPELAPA
jgi:CheY-like chemotaxis protein